LNEHRWTFDRRRRDWSEAAGQAMGSGQLWAVSASDLTRPTRPPRRWSLLRPAHRPSAVVCADDILTAGVYAAAA